jgi:membrane protein DedA with SNARE-associated domain
MSQKGVIPCLATRNRACWDMLDILFSHGSYLGIVVVLILTGCGLPIPEEVPIIVAGLLSAQGVLVPQLALLACLVGAVAGDCVMYSIGYHFGHNLLKDHPKLAHFVRADREAKFEEMIERHGLKVLFVARFMVGVRSPVYLAAGILRIPFRRFLLMDLFCATAVVGTFFGLTYFFGEQVAALFRGVEIGLTVTVLLVIAIVVAVFLWRRRVVSRRSSRTDVPVEEKPLQADRVDDGANSPKSLESVGKR